MPKVQGRTPFWWSLGTSWPSPTTTIRLWRTCIVPSCLKSAAIRPPTPLARLQRSQKRATLHLPGEEMYKEARKVAVAAILHTDNANHFSMIKDISQVYEAHATRSVSFWLLNRERRRPARSRRVSPPGSWLSIATRSWTPTGSCGWSSSCTWQRLGANARDCGDRGCVKPLEALQAMPCLGHEGLRRVLLARGSLAHWFHLLYVGSFYRSPQINEKHTYTSYTHI